jgi:aryl-alcohol dehydrogenase-like predicted oxidoreductase
MGYNESQWSSARSLERSLENLGIATIDLQQFHVWEDAWAHDQRGTAPWTT